MSSRGKMRFVFALLLSGRLLCGCAGGGSSGTSCNPDDQDGILGGKMTVLLSVSDTGFAVGGVDSGSTEPNVAVENKSQVTLTLTNVGTMPHGLRIACIPSGLPAACPAESCFPDAANIAPLAPGESATVTFVTPAQEGAYPFTSDEQADAAADTDAGVPALVGQFVLM
ncbi:MAG TPA: hypothetical protein VNW92_24175 [Polyangiaceae bacterium]|nr:hypothetical protein [Polyangiaceae bacterium]